MDTEKKVYQVLDPIWDENAANWGQEGVFFQNTINTCVKFQIILIVDPEIKIYKLLAQFGVKIAHYRANKCFSR